MKVECVSPVVAITQEAKAVLDAYLGICPQEVSGLGKITRQKDWVFLIEEIVLFSQEVTAGSTDLDEEALHQFLLEAVQRDYDPSVLRCWWHSHVNGSCFWSSVDTGTIDKAPLGDWMVSIVGNKRGEYKCRLDIYAPVRVAIDDIPLTPLQIPDVGLWKRIKAEVKEKVREKKYATAGFNQGYYGGWEKGKVWEQGVGWVWPDEKGKKEYANFTGEVVEIGKVKNGKIWDRHFQMYVDFDKQSTCSDCIDFTPGKKACKVGYSCEADMIPCVKFTPTPESLAAISTTLPGETAQNEEVMEFE